MNMRVSILACSALALFAFTGQAAASSVYLNKDNITVALGASHGGVNPFVNTTIEQGLANVIDAPSADAGEFHSQSSHVWVSGQPLELDFDFGQEYDISMLHFWNYFTEQFDVDEINFSFFDGGNSLVDTLQFFPDIGTSSPETAQDYALSFPTNIRYVNAIFTGTNGEVDFNNLGFTATVSVPPSAVPLPAGGVLLLTALAGLRLVRRRPG